MRIRIMSVVLVCLTQAAIATETTTLSEFNDYVSNEERLLGIVSNFVNRLSDDTTLTIP